MTQQKLTFQEVINLSQHIKQELYILFLTIFLLFSTFFASAQTSYPCDKDSIDMATNELWLNELEKLLPQKEQALEYWKQRVLCDTNRTVYRNYYRVGCGQEIHLYSKLPNYVPIYCVNYKIVNHKTIHLLLEKLLPQHLKQIEILPKSITVPIFGIYSDDYGVLLVEIENILQQGKNLTLRKYKRKKDELLLSLDNLTDKDSIQIIATRLCADNCKGKYSFFHLNNFAIKKGKNKIKIPYFGLPRIYTIYLNGKKEIEFFE